jgi:hypothetical protein
VDEMTALRRLRTEISRPGRDRLAGGRERLQAAIDEEAAADRAASKADRAATDRPTGGTMDDVEIIGSTGRGGQSHSGVFRRRPLLGVLVAAAAAAAVTGTVVVADGLGDRGDDASPSVSDAAARKVSVKKVLGDAADRVRDEEKGAEIDVPRDDQFIYIKETVKETDQKTGKTDTRPTENWESVDRRKRGWVNEIGHDGHWVPPLGKNESTFPPPGWKALEELPQEPVELIRHLARGPGGMGPKPKSLKDVKKNDWHLLQFSLRGLATRPIAPKGLRPAAFEALAMVPGMKAKAGVDDGKGRTAVGVLYDGKFTKEQMLLFDEDTADYIGDRDIRTTLNGKKSYEQFIYLEDYAVVDKVKQRP